MPGRPSQRSSRFGEQRLVRPDIGAAHRVHFQLFGVADPAHYIHNRWLDRELATHVTRPPSRILDAGCGSADHTFFLARRFPEASVLGMDIDGTLIARNTEVAARLGISNVRFEVGDLCALRSQSEFDMIVSIDVLEHIQRQSDALRNLAMALRLDGLACYHIPTERPRPVPLAPWLKEFHEWGEREHVADELSADEFASRVSQTGLEVLRVRRTFGYLTGELATSLFAVPYRNTMLNRALQLAVSVPCRVLGRLDELELGSVRYAVGVTSRKPS